MVTSTLKVLRERHAKKAAQLRAIVDAAEKEDRGLNTAEQAEWDSGKTEIEQLRARIQTQEDLLSAGPAGRSDDEERQEWHEGRKSHDGFDPSKGPSTLDRKRAFKCWASRGKRMSQADFESAKRCGVDIDNGELEMTIDRGVSPSGEQYQAPRSVSEARSQARGRAESRATQVVGTPASGGYVVPDEMLVALEVAKLAYSGMRQAATIVSTSSGEKLTVPTANDTGNEGVEVGEDVTATEQTTTFAEVNFGAFKYSSKMIPVSMELLQDAAINMPAFIGQIIGERIGRIQNRRFTVGTGTTQPRGITLDSVASGITAAVAGKVAFTELLGLIHSVDPAYRTQGAAFMMADATCLTLKSMADTQGRPLWLPSLVPGEPDTFHGYPYIINQHMPVGAAAKGIVFGDLSAYWIRDVMNLTFVRLNERYAEFARVAFLAWARADGRIVNAGTNPIKHMVLA